MQAWTAKRPCRARASAGGRPAAEAAPEEQDLQHAVGGLPRDRSHGVRIGRSAQRWMPFGGGRSQVRPCSSAPLTLASSALSRYSASASGEPKRRPGRRVGPVVAEHAVREREPALVVEPVARALVEQPLAEHDVAEQPALLGQPDLGAVGELARLAEVVHERRADQQVASSAAGAAGTSRARASPTATVCSSSPPR